MASGCQTHLGPGLAAVVALPVRGPDVTGDGIERGAPGCTDPCPAMGGHGRRGAWGVPALATVVADLHRAMCVLVAGGDGQNVMGVGRCEGAWTRIDHDQRVGAHCR